MSLTVEQEQYIDHEVRIRVMQEVNSENFKRLESKMNWLITLAVSGMLLPVILHYLTLI